MNAPIQAPSASRGIPVADTSPRRKPGDSVAHTSPRRKPGDSIYFPWCGQPSGLKKQLLSSPRAAT
jgi:hypothetical protein